MRKLRIAIVVVLALFAFSSIVPRTWATAIPGSSFARTYSGPDGLLASSVQQTTDGGYIVAGAAGTCSTCFGQTWLLRLDSSGGTVWQKAYGTKFTGITTPPVAPPIPYVRKTSDGGFIVASTALVSSNSVAAWIFRTDGAGTLVWQRTFTGLGNSTTRAVDTTSDGGFVDAGSFFTPARSPSLSGLASHAFVLKLDSAGGLTWQKTYDALGTSTPFSVRATSDGGFIVAGETDTFPVNPGPNAWYLRLDSLGDVLWQKTYTNPSSPPPPWGPSGTGIGTEFLSMQQTSDGGFVATGATVIVNQTTVPRVPSRTTVTNASLVIRMSSSGDIVWQRAYGGAGKPAFATSVEQTSEGGFIVAGEAELAASNVGALMLRLDPLGNIIWQRILAPPSPNIEALAFRAQQTSDGGFVAAGYAAAGVEPSGALAGFQALVLKLDAGGDISSCSGLSTSNLPVSNASFTATSLAGTAITISGTLVPTTIGSTDATATATVLCSAASCILVSKFFTDTGMNPLPLDSERNPSVDVTLAHGIVRNTHPHYVLAWVNVTNTSGFSLQSLKLNETLPIDWAVAQGDNAVRVYSASPNGTIQEITDQQSIRIVKGNPETVSLTLGNITEADDNTSLGPNESILVSVAMMYTLKASSQPASSYPRDYSDVAAVAAWTQAHFSGTELTGTVSAFFTAHARIVG